ncbi:GNAT family N-acetyltransferase [Vibrio splendidus]
MKLEFEVIDKDDLQDSHRELFAEMLKLQGKVGGTLIEKADRCKSICIASIDGKAVAIGAIKAKTNSDFTEAKAGLPELSKEFNWELGYLFTDPKFQGRKLARSIVQVLIHHFGDENLMASTEISANPGMVKILESNGFRLFGRPWKSSIHENFLGLFLKFK